MPSDGVAQAQPSIGQVIQSPGLQRLVPFHQDGHASQGQQHGKALLDFVHAADRPVTPAFEARARGVSHSHQRQGGPEAETPRVMAPGWAPPSLTTRASAMPFAPVLSGTKTLTLRLTADRSNSLRMGPGGPSGRWSASISSRFRRQRAISHPNTKDSDPPDATN